LDKEGMLQQRIWAVVGDANNPEKPASRVAQRLASMGYEVYQVHPKGGPSTFSSLRTLPHKPDVVCLVINPIAGAVYLQEAHDLGIQHIWIQPGADTPEILARCRELNLDCIQACVLVETVNLANHLPFLHSRS